jgi:two-component system sensor histidine kinase KdpD
MVSWLSHELKTPLAAIKASATALLSDTMILGLDTDVRRELAESIDRETDRLTRLVSSLLDLSRIEAGALRPQLEWVPMFEVLDEVLDRMEPILKDRRLMVDVPETLPETPLGFVQMMQVLTNLLDNAVRYSPPRTPISISAKVVANQLRITVFNQSRAIPPAQLEQLFTKFYRLRTDSPGIGLGLSIARGMVEAHHGHIWAENVGRAGVAFILTLPSPEPPWAITVLSPTQLTALRT